MKDLHDRPLDRDGVVRPELPQADDPAGDTPDIDGIEIDNALERPKEGQPGQRGPKEPE